MFMKTPTALVLAAMLSFGALAGCATETQESLVEAQATEGVESDALVVEDVPNLFKVRAGVFRGGRPTVAGYAKLKALGVKTVINLEIADIVEAKQADIDSDRANAIAAGMRWVHIPMPAYSTGLAARFDAKVNKALSLLKDHGTEGIYLHCKHGRDRTGLVMALDRVENEGWAAQRAYDEMLARGFRTYFVGLKEYFKRRSNLGD